MHRETGKLYIGAVNHLYTLNDDLTLDSTVVTGPKNDNYGCIPRESCQESQPWSDNCEVNVNCLGEYTAVPTDHVIKAVIIDYSENSLITCGSLFWGRCEKRQLENPARVTFAKSSVVSNDMTTTVMFLAPGPSRTEALYVGITCTSPKLLFYYDLIGHVSSLSTASFDYTFEGTSHQSSIKMTQTDRKDILFRHGFSSGGFSYFAIIRNETVYSSHLARVCQNDTKFSSYAEIPLVCNHGGVSYNVLQAAYVTHPGSLLARHLGLPHVGPFNHNSDVLFGVFGTTDYTLTNGANDSVLCVYTLSEIRRSFTGAIQKCFSGIGNIGPPEFTNPQSCSHTVSMNFFFLFSYYLRK